MPRGLERALTGEDIAGELGGNQRIPPTFGRVCAGPGGVLGVKGYFIHAPDFECPGRKGTECGTNGACPVSPVINTK